MRHEKAPRAICSASDAKFSIPVSVFVAIPKPASAFVKTDISPESLEFSDSADAQFPLPRQR